MCHVLIIKDDALAAMDIRETVQRAGATSFSFADTHRDAVECARERRPEVIISDVMLASGLRTRGGPRRPCGTQRDPHHLRHRHA